MNIRSVYSFARDPRFRFNVLASKGLFNHIPDEQYIKLAYKKRTGKELNLNHPVSFNEKIQWLKLHDRNPIYTTLVDKYEVKKYVSQRIGEDHIIPTLGVWNSFGEIDFSELPNQFVLKCTHDSGGLAIIKNKEQIDLQGIKRKLEHSLKNNYYWQGREWPYKDVKPRIIAEEYLTDESGYELKDYKVFCFNGAPKMIQVDYDRYTDHKRNLYTIDWEYIESEIKYPTDPKHQIQKPKCLEEMLKSARILSENIPHVRVDFYILEDRFFFGELTFHHGSGCEEFRPEKLNYTMGEWLILPSNE